MRQGEDRLLTPRARSDVLHVTAVMKQENSEQANAARDFSLKVPRSTPKQITC